MKNSNEIQSLLKSRLGYNRTQVSVSAKHSCITFTVRKKDVDFKKVEEFGNQFENIYRCEATGEILSGGNTFVDVRFSEEVKNEIKQDFIEVCEKAITELETIESDNQGVDIKGTEYTIFKYGCGYSLYANTFITNVYSAGELALIVAKNELIKREF